MPEVAARVMRSTPRVVLPIWRPQAATLKRLALLVISCCAGCSAGSWRESGWVGLDGSESGDHANDPVPVGSSQLGKLGRGLLLDPVRASSNLGSSRKRAEGGGDGIVDQLGELIARACARVRGSNCSNRMGGKPVAERAFAD